MSTSLFNEWEEASIPRELVLKGRQLYHELKAKYGGEEASEILAAATDEGYQDHHLNYGMEVGLAIAISVANTDSAALYTALVLEDVLGGRHEN